MSASTRLVLPGLLLMLGCEGALLGGGTPVTEVIGGEEAEPELPIVTACTDTPTPGSAPLRRLSHEEYRNVVADLFGDVALANLVTKDFIQDPTSRGFTNAARFLDVKLVLAQEYMKAAEALTARALEPATIATVAPCHSSGTEACAEQVFNGFMRKVYRRPLTADEKATYLAVYRAGREGADFKTGLEWVLLAAFQSPHFLYRPEVEGPNTQRPVTPFELANRLSFFIWRSLPDDALMTAALTGKLATPADVEREARRMLNDPKAERIFEFFEQWLDIDELPAMARNPVAFPGLSPALASDLREEARQFVVHKVLEDDATLEQLFSSPDTYVNGALAQHYGLSGITGPGFQKTTWTSGRRGGLFMLSGSLISHDKETRTSIVNRGLRVHTLLKCGTVSAPPDDADLTLGPINASFSQADRLAAHRTNASCYGCHAIMDPLGEPFEHIDAVGRERTVDEAGRPLPAAGTQRDIEYEVCSDNGLCMTVNKTETLADGMKMMTSIAKSPELRECTVNQLFRFAHGRAEETADLCSRQRTRQAFKDSGDNVKELFVALTQTDDFLLKPEVTP